MLGIVVFLESSLIPKCHSTHKGHPILLQSGLVFKRTCDTSHMTKTAGYHGKTNYENPSKQLKCFCFTLLRKNAFVLSNETPGCVV